jgi:hypothetical protein
VHAVMLTTLTASTSSRLWISWIAKKHTRLPK